MGDEVGANPYEAYQRGEGAVTIAETFTGLKSAFDDAITAAKTAAVEPPCANAYPEFGEANAALMADIQEHGMSLGGNVQAGAQQTANTDSEAGDDFTDVGGVLSRQINEQTSRYTGE